MVQIAKLRWLGLSAGLALLVALAVSAGVAAQRCAVQPPSTEVLRPTPNVLVAVKALERLETVAFHMERVLDLTDKQSRLFGMIESEDAVLLVAVANVTAGVDLAKLGPEAITVDPGTRSVHVRLPAAEIFSTALDNEQTYVHTRRTGLLAQRREDLETRARQEAERTLQDAARKAGILAAASKNAQRAVEALLRSLEFQQIEVVAPSN